MPIESLSMSMFPRRSPGPELRHGPFLERLTDAGVDVHPVEQSRVGWWLDGLGVRRALGSLAGRRGVDAVLGWWAELAYSTELLATRRIFAGTLAAAPYSLWWGRRAGRPRWLHRRMDERLVAATARRSDRVFANSAHTASQVRSLLGVEPRRIEIVHPPVSDRFAKPDRLVSGRIERLIFFGRLRPKKGIFDLIEALGALGEARWRLKVAGSGDADGVLRAAHRAGIVDRVTLLGEIEPDELSRELEWAQLAVLPSHEESFGLAVAEAQVAGLPVVAYDIGAIPEILASEGEVSGWLVPVGRVDRLTAAIAEALSDGDEARRRSGGAQRNARRLLAHSPGRMILGSIEAWRSDPLAHDRPSKTPGRDARGTTTDSR
jgi:glycosyltransferase involved in cell wall biosynthesis